MFQDSFWEAYGLGASQIDETVRAIGVADDDATVQAIVDGKYERFDFTTKGTKARDSSGVVWKVKKGPKDKSGSPRYYTLTRTFYEDGQRVTETVRVRAKATKKKKIKRTAVVKDGRFKIVSVKRIEHPIETANQAIEDISREDQNVKNPGTTPAGNTGKKSKDDDDDDKQPEASQHSTGHVSSGRPTTTVLTCSVIGSGPCTAVVTTDDGQAPRPTGTVTFTDFPTGGFFSPSPTCTLTPFPPQANRSSCQVFYFSVGPTTILAQYLPDAGFLPSHGTDNVP